MASTITPTQSLQEETPAAETQKLSLEKAGAYLDEKITTATGAAKEEYVLVKKHLKELYEKGMTLDLNKDGKADVGQLADKAKELAEEGGNALSDNKSGFIGGALLALLGALFGMGPVEMLLMAAVGFFLGNMGDGAKGVTHGWLDKAKGWLGFGKKDDEPESSVSTGKTADETEKTADVAKIRELTELHQGGPKFNATEKDGKITLTYKEMGKKSHVVVTSTIEGALNDGKFLASHVKTMLGDQVIADYVPTEDEQKKLSQVLPLDKEGKIDKLTAMENIKRGIIDIDKIVEEHNKPFGDERDFFKDPVRSSFVPPSSIPAKPTEPVKGAPAPGH